MAFGAQGVNLHAPGPIGDTTPSTLAGTTLNLTATTTQYQIGYSGSVYTTFSVASNGYSVYDMVGAGLQIWEWRIAGATIFNLLPNGTVVANGASASYGVNNRSAASGVPIYSVDSNTGGGSGISWEAANTLGFCTATTVRMKLTNTTFVSTVPITVPGTTSPLITTSSAITSGGAAALGTLTNAPTAGNPTKWFPINDNGTTRYVPAW